MKELKETATLMVSEDYKERFRAEYHQVETRFIKLRAMCLKWDHEGIEGLGFTPTCPRDLYEQQLGAMMDYLRVLITRSQLENVELEIDPELNI